jgi:hypothetical protein
VDEKTEGTKKYKGSTPHAIKSAPRAMQGIVAKTSKISSNDVVDDSESLHENQTRMLLLNFDGLAAWNANSELKMRVQPS